MNRNLTIMIGLFAWIFTSFESRAQISLMQDYTNRYSPGIGVFQGIQFRESGFSGMYPIPNTNGTEFWVVSDRGVNIDGANANLSGCRPTYDKIYAFPNYAPKIHRIRIQGDSIQILQTITIKRPNGTGATGLLNPTGFGSTAAEIVSTDTVLNCSNFNLKTAGKDIWGIDAEGIVVDRDGNFWLCEEGGPTIWKLNPNGVVIKRYTPYANLPGAQGIDVMIDSVFKYRKNNRGFEGISITPNGKIYAVIQSPILYPTKSIGEGTMVHRILEIDPVSNATRMFVYLNDGIIGTGSDQIRLRDWKLGDMAAINDSTFLVLEAAARGTTDIKRLYHINISKATPVNSGLYGGLTLEALVDAGGLSAYSIVPVKKTLVMDLLANGWNPSLDKAEGIAIINDSTIAIGNDNDYGQYSPTEDGVATATSNTSHVVVYRLSGANKLVGYQAPVSKFVPGVTGLSTTQSPYLNPLLEKASFTSILTAGDYVGNYRMCGTPDGLGAFDNNNGTFTLVMNHEFGNTAGVTRAHGSTGSFVSKWIINKSDLTVQSGADLIKDVYLWNGSGYTKYNTNTPMSTGFNRFCSADLPAVSAFYNAATGKGTQARIFMNGEESGSEGRAFAHIVTGSSAGSSYELPYLGKFSWENSVANPNPSDKTIVAGTDDATPGQIYIYIGTKSKSGLEIEKAGLSGGKLYGIAVNGFISESSSGVPSANTKFTLADLGQVQNMTGSAINTASNTAGVTSFLRPEDGAWDPANPNDFYFVTTNSFSSPSRLWRLHFTDINNPELGGTITAMLDGTEGQKMLDNMTIDNFGHILMQEDVGNNSHNGKIWQYTIATDALMLLAEHDQTRFISGSANYLTQDEESSGLIDVQGILGAGMFLLVDQAHYSQPGELVEGGQLLALFNPDTYNSNPMVSVSGNNTFIPDGNTLINTTDNTDFGVVGSIQTKSFVISNAGPGALIVNNITIDGSNGADFSLVNAPAFPVSVGANTSLTITVKFAPATLGKRNAKLHVWSNDYFTSDYDFNLQGLAIAPGQTGLNSSQSPYLTNVKSGVSFSSLLTTGDYVANYRMCGTPDGLGAFDNNNGTFTLVMNHEFGNSAGVVRAHGSKGAFVSKWVINKSNLNILSGADLINNVYLWNGSAYTMYNTSNPMSTGFNRFCSADLPEVSAFYNAVTGKGTQARIFMNGEESGSEGRAFAHIITGPSAGSTYELPYLGKFSWENSVANPNPSDKTIVAGTDDATPGQIYIYIGTKSKSGLEIEKAGLSGGKLYGVAVNGLLTESSSSIPTANTSFTLADLGQVQNMTGSAINTASNTAGVTSFLRPEDGAWDPANPSDFYFVTTNGFNNPSRLWKLHFTDINNPELGGTITAMLDGTEGQKMLDNMTIDKFGHILMQEDVGNNVHNGKIWQYTIATDELELIAQHDETRFISGAPSFLTQDEESSGLIDVQGILGAGMFLLVDQAHYSQPGELVEGGQLLAMYNPDTYLESPEIAILGNEEEIRNGSIAPKTYDNTDFGTIKPSTSVVKTFEIRNNAIGNLTVKGISISGVNASEFVLEGLPSFPLTLTSGEVQTVSVRFTPTAVGLRTAKLNVMSNDYDESHYIFAIQGVGATPTDLVEIDANNSLKLYPNPSNELAVLELHFEANSTVQIQVFNISGQEVLASVELNNTQGEERVEFQTAGLDNGIYIVEVTRNGEVLRLKLVVNH